TPTPVRARSAAWPPPIWSIGVKGAPWGIAADAAGAVVTTDAGYVLSISKAGATRWSTRVEGIAQAWPAITSHAILVGASGRVVALGRSDGAVLWQRSMDGEVTSVALG